MQYLVYLVDTAQWIQQDFHQGHVVVASSHMQTGVTHLETKHTNHISWRGVTWWNDSGLFRWVCKVSEDRRSSDSRCSLCLVWILQAAEVEQSECVRSDWQGEVLCSPPVLTQYCYYTVIHEDNNTDNVSV